MAKQPKMYCYVYMYMCMLLCHFVKLQCNCLAENYILLVLIMYTESVFIVYSDFFEYM